MIQDWISKITDRYVKNPKSGIGKLFIIVDGELEEVRKAFQTIEEWRILDKAQGTTLDLMGENISQKRGKLSDDIYRMLIRGKEALNRSDGTFNRIIETLAVTLECEASDINIQSLKEVGNDEPAVIIITKAPLEALNRVGISPHQFTQITQEAALAGVRVDSINFPGTFEFGTTTMEIDPNAGFADLEETTGGYFGMLLVPAEEENLPI